MLSCDDKSKTDVFKAAVNKHIRGIRYQNVNEDHVISDHDFPVANNYKINTSGYLEIHFEKPYGTPKEGQLHLYLRSNAHEKMVA